MKVVIYDAKGLLAYFLRKAFKINRQAKIT